MRRSVELLVTPAVDHLPYLLSPTREPETIVIHLVMFHDHPVGEIEKYGMFQQDIISKTVSKEKKKKHSLHFTFFNFTNF